MSKQVKPRAWSGGVAVEVAGTLTTVRSRLPKGYDYRAESFRLKQDGAVVANGGCARNVYVGRGPDELLPLATFIAEACGYEAEFTKRKPVNVNPPNPTPKIKK